MQQTVEYTAAVTSERYPTPRTEQEHCYSWVGKLGCPEFSKLKSKGGTNANNTGGKEFYGKTQN